MSGFDRANLAEELKGATDKWHDTAKLPAKKSAALSTRKSEVR